LVDKYDEFLGEIQNMPRYAPVLPDFEPHAGNAWQDEIKRRFPNPPFDWRRSVGLGFALASIFGGLFIVPGLVFGNWETLQAGFWVFSTFFLTPILFALWSHASKCREPERKRLAAHREYAHERA
jgi:hypothetical protein